MPLERRKPRAKPEPAIACKVCDEGRLRRVESRTFGKLGAVAGTAFGVVAVLFAAYFMLALLWPFAAVAGVLAALGFALARKRAALVCDRCGALTPAALRGA